MTDDAKSPMTTEEVRMGDYNTLPHTTLFREMSMWIEKEGAQERSPDERTHDRGNKLDLIIAKYDPDSGILTRIYHNGQVEHSNHKCQFISMAIQIPASMTPTMTDYRNFNKERITELAKKLDEPADYKDLMKQLDTIRSTIKTSTYQDRRRISKDLLEKRREMRRTRGTERHRDSRLDYRKALRDHMNEEITKTIDDAVEAKDFFQLNRRGINKKLIPSPTDDTGKVHHSHEEISNRLAKHHGEGDLAKQTPYKPTRYRL